MSDRYTFHNQNLRGSAWKNYNEMWKAIRCKDISLVEYLIGKGAQVNGHCERNFAYTPLHLAVVSRTPEIVKILLDNGANINEWDASGQTSLILAAKVGDKVIIDLLLSHNVENHRCSRDGLCHLHIACMSNKLDVVKRLVLADNGESLNKVVEGNSVFWPGFTPLHFAVYHGCTQTVQYLLECGVDMMCKDSKNLTPLHWAELRRNEEIIDLLLAFHKYEFQNPVSPQGMTHFHIACTRDDPLVVEHFLKLGVNINLQVHGSRYWRGWTPIQLAMYYDCPRVVELLLGFKIDCIPSSESPWIPDLLKYAFVSGNTTLYNLFTETKSKSYHFLKETKNTLDLLIACTHNDAENIEHWLSRNPGVNLSDFSVPDWNGYTHLHLTVKSGSQDAAQFLLAHGADILIQDSRGKTALHMAFEQRRTNIMNIIIDKFTDSTINVTDDVGLSFLHILCSTSKLKIVENFLSKGIDINAKVESKSPCWAGFSPMHFACRFQQKATVELLLKHGADIFIKNNSIDDHFNLIFEDFHTQFFLPEFQKILLENLMTVFSSPSAHEKYSNNCRISPLHALCLDTDADLEMLEQFVASRKNEVNQAIEMPESRKYHKCTPLHFAMGFGNFEQAEIMVNAKADASLLNDTGDTPIELALLYGNPLDLFDELADTLFPVGSSIGNLKPSHFFVACATHLVKFVTYVLENVTDPDLKRSFLDCCSDINQTPLHLLSKQDELDREGSLNRKQMMQLLLNHGAKVDAKNFRLQTPLYYAQKKEVIFLLVTEGAEVNIQDVYGETPLHRACRRWEETKKAVIALLESGADINIEDRAGRTCLMSMGRLSSLNDLNRRSMEQFVIPLLKHVKKLHVIRSYISKKNNDVYNDLLEVCSQDFNETKFQIECEKELEAMKLKKINRYTTIHDILYKSSHGMTFYCENDALRSMFKLDSESFPIYSPIVRLQMNRGRTRKPLLENSKKPFITLIGRSLPQECLEQIIRYLSDGELENIIRSEKCKAHVDV